MIINTKYNIEDEVWLMMSNKPKKVTIIGILITKGEHRKSENYIMDLCEETLSKRTQKELKAILYGE